MCGVIYGSRSDGQPIGNAVLKRYNHQRKRGFNGFGYIAITDGYISEYKRFEKEEDCDAAVRQCQASEILFHHRLPTSVDNYEEVAHPIKISNKILKHDYYLIHNGVLRNHDYLKVKHEKLGFKYTTIIETETITRTVKAEYRETKEEYNDSEALAVDLALFLERKQEKIESVGTIAFICLQTNKRGRVLKIFYGRNTGNPLVLEKNNDLFFIKSEGAGISIKQDELVELDYKTKELSIREVEIGKEYYKASKQGYTGFRTDSERRTIEEDMDRLFPSPYSVKKDDYDTRLLLDGNGSLKDQFRRQNNITEEKLMLVWEEISDLKVDMADAHNELANASLSGMQDNILYYSELIMEMEAQIEELIEEAGTIAYELYGEDAGDDFMKDIRSIDF